MKWGHGRILTTHRAYYEGFNGYNYRTSRIDPFRAFVYLLSIHFNVLSLQILLNICTLSPLVWHPFAYVLGNSDAWVWCASLSNSKCTSGIELQKFCLDKLGIASRNNMECNIQLLLHPWQPPSLELGFSCSWMRWGPTAEFPWGQRLLDWVSAANSVSFPQIAILW